MKKPKQEKIVTVGPYDVIRTTISEKDGAKIRVMPPVVLDPNKKTR
jgi:hypothetical protein